MKAAPTDVSEVRKLETLFEVRSIAELMRYVALSEHTLITSAPAGDGRPILVIPGFLCNDAATWALRRFLRKIGYRSFRWKQGINWGPRPGVRTRLLHRLNELRARYAQTVTIIGWSLGGLYARELSNIRPDLVREVITLGSPLQGEPQSTAVWRLFDWINREYLRDLSSSTLELCRQVETPSLSIFSRGDGIVPWPMCMPVRGHHAHYWEVRGSHIGLIYSPEVMHVLASHLAESRAERSLQQRALKNQRKIARAVKAAGASPLPAVSALSRLHIFLVSAEEWWKAASGWAGRKAEISVAGVREFLAKALRERHRVETALKAVLEAALPETTRGTVLRERSRLRSSQSGLRDAADQPTNRSRGPGDLWPRPALPFRYQADGAEATKTLRRPPSRSIRLTEIIVNLAPLLPTNGDTATDQRRSRRP